MDTDNQLLESYAANGSESAFRELIERHINLVHSAALRESGGNASLAEEITQAVFTELARRATKLVRHTALAGWLYTCVRRMTANVRRAEDRRQRREQEAITMNELLGFDSADNLWQQVRPVLDDVMHELNEEDRTAVVLRFFEGRNLKEVGLVLGLTENAARMRVERSLEKLRGLLSQRGVKSTASTLAAALATGAAITAPATLASTVASGALATVAASSSSATFALAKLLGITKTQVAAGGALLVLVAMFTLWHQVRPNRAGTENVQQTQPALSDASPSVGADAGDQDDTAIPASAPTNAASSSPMALQIVEAETGTPLPYAKLHLFYLLQDGRGKVVKAATDANGELNVDTPQRPFHGLNMFVTADGHVPKVIAWGFGRALPAEYTMKLERGVTIGGVVVDDAGQPIAGAEIQFDGPGNDMSLPEHIQFGPDTTTRTDSAARWFCNMVPKHLRQVSLLITHPDHAETAATIQPGAPEANNSTITMKAGFTVAGAVQDWNGNLIDGAKVREVRMNEEGERSTTTDASATFEFKNMKAGELMMAVQAKGFAPAVQTLQVTGTLAGLRFQLGPGQLLRGRVTDENGNPIAHAWAETTRGRRKIQWSATTDADGQFEWDSAPQEPLLYSFQADGFNRGYALKLQADGSVHEIKLSREQPGKDTVQITGSVVDEDTGLPLDAFDVLMGDLEPDHAYPLHFGTSGKDGRFTLSRPSGSSRSTYQLQIEKTGYRPAVSTELSMKDGNQTLEFKLRKGSGVSGVVLFPGGKPAANATVLLCTTQAGVTMRGPARVEKGLNTTRYCVQTDEAGRFSLPAATSPQGLIVIHDQGYAEAPLAASSSLSSSGGEEASSSTFGIFLQPWGRVEGALVLDSQPVANERIMAGSSVARYDETGRRFGFLSFYFEAKTDSAGMFSFEKVPPGQCNVFRQTLLSHAGFESHETSVVVNAGTVTQVVLGGGGRPIVGKVILAGADGTINWQSVPVHLRLKTADEPGTRPKRQDFSSKEAYIEAMEHFFDAHRARRRFGAFCDGNGSFRLQDVPAGTYELEITCRGFKPDSAGPNELAGMLPEIASLIREVTVTEISGDQSHEPMDLGTLELVPRQDNTSVQ